MNRWIPDIPITTLLIVIATIAAAVGLPLVTPSPATPPSPILASSSSMTVPPILEASPPMEEAGATIDAPMDVPPREYRAPLGEADGAVPDGVTVFNDNMPAVVNLNPALLGALQQAATDAAYDGVEFYVTSGWRSPEYQTQLLREAVATYGSEAEAARWAATAETSAHVPGDAVDIGSYDAMAWLSEHGAAYGLCQIYDNEPWHYEFRPDAGTYGCPPLYADPTQDPRMQR